MSTDLSLGISADVTVSPTYRDYQSETPEWINNEEWGYGVGFNAEARIDVGSFGFGLDIGGEQLNFSPISHPDIPVPPDGMSEDTVEWDEYNEASYQSYLQHRDYISDRPPFNARLGLSTRYSMSISDSLRGTVRLATGYSFGQLGDGVYGALLFGIANRLMDGIRTDFDLDVNVGPSISYFFEDDLLVAGLTFATGLDFSYGL